MRDLAEQAERMDAQQRLLDAQDTRLAALERRVDELLAAEAVQFLFRYFKSSMGYSHFDPNLMTTAQHYAAGKLPAADRTRYDEFLDKHPQLKDQGVLRVIVEHASGTFVSQASD